MRFCLIAVLAIMKFQGEISQRKLLRKQSPVELVEYVVGRGIELPDLRDEIYCQLCKQTNNNPKPDTAIRGWEMMALVCSAFPPSKMLIKYVCNYIQSSIPREGKILLFYTYKYNHYCRYPFKIIHTKLSPKVAC